MAKSGFSYPKNGIMPLKIARAQWPQPNKMISYITEQTPPAVVSPYTTYLKGGRPYFKGKRGR